MHGGKFGQSLDLNTEIERQEKIKKIMDDLNKPDEELEKEEKEEKSEEDKPEKKEAEKKKEPEDETSEPEDELTSKPDDKKDPLEEDVNALLSPPDVPAKKPKKDLKRFTWLLCLLIILFFGFISLSQSFNIPSLEDRAERTIETMIFVEASRQIEADWPFISKDAKELKIRQLARELLQSSETKKKQVEIENQLQSLYRTEKGLPYVYDIDPYYFLSTAAGIESGRRPAFNPLIKLESFAYNFLNKRDQLTTYSDAAFYLPLIFGLLTLVFFFFLVWILTKKLEIAFIAGIVMSLHHRFFFATGAGMIDTQSINLLFTAIFLLFAFGTVYLWDKSKKFSIISALIALIVFILFNKTWGGAFYILVLFATAAGILIIFKLWKKKAFIRIGLLLASVALGIWIFTLTHKGHKFFEYVLGYLRVIQQTAAIEQIAELYGRDIQVFAVALGGWIPLILAMIGFIWIIVITYKKPKLSGIFIIIWFATMAFATFQSIRFMYYAIFPTALLVGFVLHKTSKGLRTVFSAKTVKAKLSIISIILLLVLVMMTPFLILTQHKVLPKMNDGMAIAGLKIRAFTDENSRIITWWDYGHIWRYAAERNSLIDGGTQGTTFTYWIARSLVTQDADLSEKIWKLLACKKVSQHPDDVFYDTLDSKQIGLKELEANSTCSDPLPQVIIVNEEMIGVAPAIADLVMAHDAEFYYDKIESTSIVSCKVSKAGVICGDLTVDLNTLTAKGGIPVHFFVNGTRTKSNKTSQSAAIVFLSNNELYAFVTSSWFAETTMIRLFAGENMGLEPLAFVNAPKRIAVYKHIARIETEEELAAVLSAELKG